MVSATSSMGISMCNPTDVGCRPHVFRHSTILRPRQSFEELLAQGTMQRRWLTNSWSFKSSEASHMVLSLAKSFVGK